MLARLPIASWPHIEGDRPPSVWISIGAITLVTVIVGVVVSRR